MNILLGSCSEVRIVRKPYGWSTAARYAAMIFSFGARAEYSQSNPSKRSVEFLRRQHHTTVALTLAVGVANGRRRR